MDRHGQGKAVGVRCVLAGYGPVGQGKAVEARSGLVRRVKAVGARFVQV